MASKSFYKSLVYSLWFCMMLFIVIPIRIDKEDNLERKAYTKTEFTKYLRKFNKSYSLESPIYNQRLTIFQDALSTIEVWNHNRESNYSALYGLTAFADLSQEEFERKYLKGKHRSNHQHSRSRPNHVMSKRAVISSKIPQKVDWRAKGVVSAVRDQGPCGACWAFSTVATIESMLAIKTGKLKDLSVQEVKRLFKLKLMGYWVVIIDCARNGNLGCNGGDFCSLLDWMTVNDVTLGTEGAYPLQLKNNVCRWKKGNPGVHVASNYTCDYLVRNENILLETIANHGPVIVAVNAISWQYYLGGVIQHNCPGEPELLNHAVAVVGYDLTAPIPHYIAKNSWGKRFGDNGYVKIATYNNVCGVACEVSSLDVME